MAFNNGFPMNYGYMQQPPVYPQPGQQVPQPQQDSAITWVIGEAGAKSFLMGPNKTIPLGDTEAQTIYIKSTDSSGMPTMKVIDYTIRDSANAAQRTPLDDKVVEYVKRDELEAVKGELLKEIANLKEDLGA